MGEFIIGIMAGMTVGVGVTAYAYINKISRIRNEIPSGADLGNSSLSGGVYWEDINYSDMETSHDEILITNDRGWYRICTCLGGKNGGVDFYDAYERKIKGFNPTRFARLKK